MRWITLGAVAVTLGVLLAYGIEQESPHLTRSAAPRFGEEARRSDSGADRRPAGVSSDAPDLSGDDAPIIEEDRHCVDDTDPTELARAGTWRKALQHYARWGDVEEQIPAATKHLRRALAQAENPVARQNVIFLAIRALPLDQARTLLSPLLRSGSEGDVEDVVCALAFAGDDAMAERFHELAQRRSPAIVAQLRDTLSEIELLAAAANNDAREILRSYRAFEVLARRNYFYLVDPERESGFPYRGGVDDDRESELWTDWLARYAGHPGSDDVALEMADGHRWSNKLKAAAWYDRAASLPDQMRTSRALRGLLNLAERGLTVGEVRKLLASGARNRSLLTYVVLRRIAAEESCQSALDAVAAFAAENPGTALARAWHIRRPGPVENLAPTDDGARLGAYYDRIAAGRSSTKRMFPDAEAMPLSIDALARQFESWERFVEFEAEIADASAVRAASRSLDLARFVLEHPDLFFPVYVRPTLHAGKMLAIRGERRPAQWSAWTAQSVSAARALLMLSALQRLHPELPRMDELLFLKVDSLMRLLDCLPLEWVPTDNGENVDVRPGPDEDEVAAVLVAANRCRTAFPQSAWTERAEALGHRCRASFPEQASE